MAKEKLTAQIVRELLDYNPKTGIFLWREKRSNRVKAGSVAGSITPNGYRFMHVGGYLRSAHRLAWLYVFGVWPVLQIDHINGVRDDNRIGNLREASPSQNQHNRGLQSTNKSGFKGVSRRGSNQRWRAGIRAFGKTYHLGYFDTAEAASIAYFDAAARLHGSFSCTTRGSA